MKHDVNVIGHGFRLRPIGDADAEFVLSLRGNRDKSRYLHPISGGLEGQLRWLSAYYSRPGDYYFVVEKISDGNSEGLISIYDVREIEKTAEWGRWILVPGSIAATESAWLIYRVAFEHLELSSVVCRTVADNAQVVSFHESCGIRRRRLMEQYFEFGGVRSDAIEHQVQLEDWAEISTKLERLAKGIARRTPRD